MTITLRDVFLLTGFPITGSVAVHAINPGDNALPSVGVSSGHFSSYASVAKKDCDLKEDPLSE